jgi:hypothetical protein
MVTRTDDEDLSDFEPAFLARGKRVYRDGKGPRVPMMLTDGGIPPWAPRPRPAAVFDASGHRPGPIRVLSDEAMKDARLAAMDARTRYIQEISDAWKVQPVATGGAAHTTAPGAPEPDDDDTMSPRDRYIAGLQNAYKTPMGQAPAASADDIERARQQWLSPGAKPGGGFGDARPGVSRETATQDARETAYREYVARISGAWRTR